MPYRVDGIGFHRDERAAGALTGSGKAVVAVDGLEPGIEAQAAALGQVLGNPGLGRFFRDLVGHEGGDVDLAADGQGVAAVDEDRGAIGQHDGEAGRAAEAGEPAQALRAARHVLALMLVGPWHNEAVDAAAREFGPQQRQSLGRCGRHVESVVGSGELCPPSRQRPGQFGIGIGGDEFEPFRAGQAFGGGGHAPHQGIQGGRVCRTATPAQELKNVVGS